MMTCLLEANAKLQKTSVNLHGHATSFSLEGPFLDRIRQIAIDRKIPFAAFIREIDDMRPDDMNLSSALRLVAFHSLQTDKM